MRSPRKLLAAILLASVVGHASTVAAHDTEFCERLAAFESASFDQTGDQQARWVEMHWRGRWMDFDTGWAITCLSSEDDASREWCKWLPSNSSYEFAYQFPRKILECHDYRLPAISGWKGEVGLFEGEDRYHVLLVDFATLKGETGAVRYVSVSDDAVAPEIEERALTAMPPLAK